MDGYLLSGDPDRLCMECPENTSYTKEDMIAYYRNMEKLVLDDYVMKDYHVDKSLGLEHFFKWGVG